MMYLFFIIQHNRNETTKKEGINVGFLLFTSATVNNLQAKVDALEKSNTKLTEEVSVIGKHLMFWPYGIKCRNGKEGFIFRVVV